MKTKSQKTLSLAAVAIAGLLLSGQSKAFGWGVDTNIDADIKTNTQDAKRDAIRDSNNRVGTRDTNIAGDNVVNSNNRTGGYEVGRNSKVQIVDGGIHIGNDYSATNAASVGGINGGSLSTKGSGFGPATATSGGVTSTNGFNMRSVTGGSHNDQSIKNSTVILGNVSSSK